MSISDETLMAFADGECDETTRRAVEQAMREDPALADKVRQHQALRSNVFAAFAPTLDEAVPQRLQVAARSGKVVHLDTLRAARSQPPAEPEQRRWSWPEWGALAATLVLGVLAGSVGLKSIEGDAQLAALGEGGALTARGTLAEALSQQLAGSTGAGAVRIGVSFVSKEGAYCRSFMLAGAGGLACRSGSSWQIPVMANSAVASAGDYRQAGSAMPAAVLEAIDERIAGQTLDAGAEKAALQKGWQR